MWDYGLLLYYIYDNWFIHAIILIIFFKIIFKCYYFDKNIDIFQDHLLNFQV